MRISGGEGGGGRNCRLMNHQRSFHLLNFELAKRRGIEFFPWTICLVNLQ